MSKKKTDEELDDEKFKYAFNQGRLCADKKWVDAIDNRIYQLEQADGISTLRGLRENVRYRLEEWNVGDELL